MKRIFFGLPVTDNFVQDFKNEVLKNNPEIDEKVRWLRLGNYHITVRFVGMVDPELLPNLITAVMQVVQSFDSFIIQTDKINHFFQSGVIVVDIQTHEKLQDLFNQLEKIMLEFNFSTERRIFHPHVTLCRLKKKSHFHMEDIAVTPKTIMVRELALYESESHKEGSIYKILHLFRFKL